MRRAQVQKLLRSSSWAGVFLAAALLFVPAVPAGASSEPSAGPEKVHQRSSGNSSSRGSSSAGRSSSSRSSSSSGKTGSVKSHSTGGSRGGSVKSSGGSRGRSGYSGSSDRGRSRSAQGKIDRIRSYQTTSSGGGSGGGGYTGGGHHGHGGYYGGYHYYYPHYGFHFRFGSPYGWWHWPYLSPYYPYHNYGPRYVIDELTPLGAIDLNVRPKDTRVYVNGRYVGTTRQLDGVPRYLWLEVGTYELIFYNPGYETVVREYQVHPDHVIKERFRLPRGESIPPEELSQRIHENPPPRPRVEVETATVTPPRAPRPVTPAPRSAPAGAVDAREAPVKVYVELAPKDASVYLDGRFLGTGKELASGILIDPGEHTLEILHPGYGKRDLSFDAEAGEQVKFEVELEPKA